MSEVMEQEITELAERLYNFRNVWDIKSIKATIKSFLLANHYRQLDPDQSLPKIHWRDDKYDIQNEMRKEHWVKCYPKEK